MVVNLFLLLKKEMYSIKNVECRNVSCNIFLEIKKEEISEQH